MFSRGLQAELQEAERLGILKTPKCPELERLKNWCYSLYLKIFRGRTVNSDTQPLKVSFRVVILRAAFFIA